jgi:murein DD-endopeptidase MepM/ murein hydrolase activator NlpD
MHKAYFLGLLSMMLWACAFAPAALQPSPSLIIQSTPSQTPTARITRSPTGTLEENSPQPSPTPGPWLCSPLEGYTQADLAAAISNPFHPPAKEGSDDPHQAIDLAVTQNGLAIAGDPVHAILPGYVAAVIVDRLPYGNAIMVETPLKGLPSEWLDQQRFPTPAPTLPPHPALTCPQVDLGLHLNNESRSLYLLYAHMQTPTDYQLGDTLNCGARLGYIGQSGNALNPHVHIEVRLGAGGARFQGLAHYETRASPAEMSAYCTWRVSGIFQLIDPMRLLAALP